MKSIIVKSSKHLTDEQALKIQKKAIEKYGNDVYIKYIVNEDLISGIVIFDGDMVIDSSIAKQLNNIKNLLK